MPELNVPGVISKEGKIVAVRPYAWYDHQAISACYRRHCCCDKKIVYIDRFCYKITGSPDEVPQTPCDSASGLCWQELLCANALLVDQPGGTPTCMFKVPTLADPPIYLPATVGAEYRMGWQLSWCYSGPNGETYCEWWYWLVRVVAVVGSLDDIPCGITIECVDDVSEYLNGWV